MSQTVAILPGIFSGMHTTRRLRQLLEKAGYKIINDADTADIVLAHSAGCLWLPPVLSQQKLVLVDPPYWPGKTIRQRARARSRSNLRFRQFEVPILIWVARQTWGIYYAICTPRRTRYILKHIIVYKLPDAIQNREVVLVRNQHDDWLTPDLTELERANPKLTIIRLPGDHDDINYHPERYVELLQLLAEGDRQ